MKCNELIRRIEDSKCYLVRHGKRHDVWYSPITHKTVAVPRHGSQEIPSGTARSILRDLLGK